MVQRASSSNEGASSYRSSSDNEESIASHLVITNLGKLRYKPKLERAHRDVPVRTQYVVRTIKEKHKHFVVKKLICSLDPNDRVHSQSRDSSSFTNEEIEVDSVLNELALNEMLGMSDDKSGTDDSAVSLSARHNVSYYLDRATRELQEASTDSDILTNISSIDLVSNTLLSSNPSSDVLSVVSSIHHEMCDYQRRTV